jgi:hypothetical protein
MYMTTKPVAVYVFPEGSESPRRLSAEETETLFDHYEDTGFEPKLEALYRLCDCDCVELVVLPGLGSLWLDEEGRLKGRKVSPVASVLYQCAVNPGGDVVGTSVLVVDPSMPASTVDEMFAEMHAVIARYRARRATLN